MRCDKQYDTMLEIENEIEEDKVQLKSIREKQMTEENIYNALLAFDDLYFANSDGQGDSRHGGNISFNSRNGGMSSNPTGTSDTIKWILG